MILNKAKTVKWLWHTSFLWSFSAPSLQPDRIRHHHRIKIGSSSCKGAVRAIKAQATPALSFPHNSWCGRSNNSTEWFKKQHFLVHSALLSGFCPPSGLWSVPSSTEFHFFALGPSDLDGTPCSSKSSHNSFLHLFFTMLAAPLLWSFFSVVTVVSTTVPKRNREKRDPIQKLYCFYSSLLKTCIIEQTGTLFSKSILGLFVTF